MTPCLRPPVRTPRRRAVPAGLALAAAAALGLAGCANPGGIAPEARLIAPSAFGLAEPATAGAGPEAGAPAAGVEAGWASAEWWRAAGDPELDALVARGLADHPSLRLAAARLRSAAAYADDARAARLPQVGAEVQVSRQHFTANGLYPPPYGGGDFTNATAQSTLSYELDFFGRHAAALAAAIGAEQAAAADAASARLLLASSIAQAYVDLARALASREVALRTLEQRESLLSLTRERVGAGLDTKVELRQGEGSIPDARTQIEAFDEQAVLARHALAALTAQPPDALEALSPRLETVTALAPPTSLPADLLGRRPEIVAARWRVEASLQGVARARSDFYPDVNLVAFAGFSSFGLSKLFEAGSRNTGIGPALTLPIFDGGHLRAALRERSAEADAAVESYNEALLQAVHDVADQLASLRAIERQRAMQAEALAAAESAYDLAVQRYRAGLGTYLVVLSAETSVLAQRRAGVELQARSLATQFSLSRALGGGYQARALPAPAAALSTLPSSSFAQADAVSASAAAPALGTSLQRAREATSTVATGRAPHAY